MEADGFWFRKLPTRRGVINSEREFLMFPSSSFSSFFFLFSFAKWMVRVCVCVCVHVTGTGNKKCSLYVSEQNTGVIYCIYTHKIT